MKKSKVQLGNINLIGITTRTKNIDEMNSATAKIKPLAENYWNNQIANAFDNRKNPGVTYCVYTEFESDENGEYTCFLGEEVESFNNQNHSKYKTLVIPASIYQKFTTEPGRIPDVVIDAWQKIWKMKSKDFGGKRKFLADFEIHDYRAIDPEKAIVDIYIGIE